MINAALRDRTGVSHASITLKALPASRLGLPWVKYATKSTRLGQFGHLFGRMVRGRSEGDGVEMEARQFGQYRLETLIGAGGMGEVFRAYDTQRHRSVAVKLLPDMLSNDRGYQRRFRRESYVAAGLREPHVIPIHDFGELEGRLFIDMRLVDGESIHTILKENGPMTPPRAVHLISQVAEALAAAHADGLVHRDIKPSNVLVTENDFVYVVDFGIAQSMGSESTVLTRTGATVGTLEYMAPERFENRRIDGRVDVYSLTCLLYECLTASHPFSGRDLPSLMYAHLFSPPPQPSLTNPDVPKGFDPVIAKGMAKDPRSRFGTTTELADAARGALVPAPRGTSSAPVASVDSGSERPGTRDGRTPPPAGPVEHSERPATDVETNAWDFTAHSSHPGIHVNPTPSHPEMRVHPEPPPDAPRAPGTVPLLSDEEHAAAQSAEHRRLLPAPPPVRPPQLPPMRPPPPPPDSGATAGSGRPRQKKQKKKKLVLLGGITVATLALLAVLGAFFVHRQSGDRPPAAGAINPPTVVEGAPGEPVARPVAASTDVPVPNSTIPIGATPGFVAMAPNGQYAYTANREARSLSVIDTAQHKVTGTIPVDAGPPQFVSFTPDGRRAYMSIYNKDRTINSVAVLDTISNNILATVPVGTRPFALTVTPDGKSVYIPEHDIGKVAVMSTSTNTVTAEFGVPPNPHSIAFTADSRQAYIANHDSNVVSVLDTANNTVTRTIPVGQSPHSVAISPDQTKVANVNYDGNSVSVIDRATNTVTATIPVGVHPQDIKFSPDGQHAYVVNNDGGTVSVINMRTGKVTATIFTGQTPTSVALTPDGRQAYVTNFNSGNVTVLNTAE